MTMISYCLRLLHLLWSLRPLGGAGVDASSYQPPAPTGPHSRTLASPTDTPHSWTASTHVAKVHASASSPKAAATSRVDEALRST
jgi:hypothetical protein